MGDRLSEEDAIKYARRLKSIVGCSQDNEAAKAHADMLMRWCVGTITDDGRVWPGARQAEWLVTEASETWDRWRGPKGLLNLFRSKFVRELEPSNAFHPLPPDRPRIECSICNDFGTIFREHGASEYCSCAQGQRMAADPEFARSWSTLNRRTTIEARIAADPQPSAHEQYSAYLEQSRIVSEAIAAAERMLADPNATSEQRQLAQEAVRMYSGKLKGRPKKKSNKPGYLR